MTALADITKALNSAVPVAPGRERFVKVGASTMRALMAATDGVRPDCITNASKTVRYPIVETEEFDGWEIYDRPRESPNLGRRRA